MKRNTRLSRSMTPRYQSSLKDSMVLYSSSAGIMVIGKEPYIDFVKSTHAMPAFDIFEMEVSLYLVPDSDSYEKTERWLEENIQQIFEEELKLYDKKGRLWPPRRDWETFWEWFNLVYPSRVVHLGRRNGLN